MLTKVMSEQDYVLRLKSLFGARAYVWSSWEDEAAVLAYYAEGGPLKETAVVVEMNIAWARRRAQK